MDITLSFMELVELHERKWGTKQYPGRPTLSQLMRCPFVALWSISGRFILTVHGTPHELNELVYQAITGQLQEMPDRKLVKVFYEQRPMDFRVRLVSHKPQDAPKPPDKPAPRSIQQRPEPELVRHLPEPQPITKRPEPQEWLPDHPMTPHHGSKLEPLPKRRQHSVEYGDHLKVDLPNQRAMKPGRPASFRLHVVPEDTKPPKKPEPRPGETEEKFRERLEAEKQDRIKRILLRSQGEL